MKKWLYLSLLTLGTGFILFPWIDLKVSSLFYEAGKGFYLRHDLAFVLLYKSVNVVAVVLSFLVIGALIYIRTTNKKLVVLTAPRVLYVFLVFGIGSGLIVNAFLKENIGRARPSQILQFGGDKTFSKACEPTDQCLSNGSFTCGHCSFAFGFIAFYFLFRQRWILLLAAAYGLLVSATRIVQGGHILSDTFFSFLVMILTADLLHRYWYGRLKTVSVPKHSLQSVHFAFRKMRLSRVRNRFPVPAFGVQPYAPSHYASAISKRLKSPADPVTF